MCKTWFELIQPLRLCACVEKPFPFYLVFCEGYMSGRFDISSVQKLLLLAAKAATCGFSDISKRQIELCCLHRL